MLRTRAVTEDDKLLDALTELTNSALAQVSTFTGTAADVDIFTQILPFSQYFIQRPSQFLNVQWFLQPGNNDLGNFRWNLHILGIAAE
jgi:hypothetical protein